MTPLHEAVASEAAVPEVIRTMVDVIVKANNWSLVDAVDNAGNTALHVAARRGRPDVIPELAALNPKAKNSDGDTPFHIAARAGHPYCVEAMLQVSNTIEFLRDCRFHELNINGYEQFLLCSKIHQYSEITANRDFRPISRFILETTQDRAIVTMECK